MGGPRRCEGRLQIRQEGEWRLVHFSGPYYWDHNHPEIFCKWLSCGSAVSMEENTESLKQEMSWISAGCIEQVPSVRSCGFHSSYSAVTIKINCLGESNSNTSSLTGSQVLLSNMKVNMKDENLSGVRNMLGCLRNITGSSNSLLRFGLIFLHVQTSLEKCWIFQTSIS